MQERKDARKEGFMKGGIHEVRDAGKKGCRKEGIQEISNAKFVSEITQKCFLSSLLCPAVISSTLFLTIYT